MHIYTYHLRENGVIGKEYPSEDVIDITYFLGNSNYTYAFKIFPYNKNPEEIIIGRTYDSGFSNYQGFLRQGKIYNNQLIVGSEKSLGKVPVHNKVLSEDDHWLYQRTYHSYGDQLIYIADDFSVFITSNEEMNYSLVKNRFYNVSGRILKQYKVELINNELSINIEKEINLTDFNEKYNIVIVTSSQIIIIGYNNVTFGYSTNNNIYIYNKDIDLLESGDSITYDYKENFFSTTSASISSIFYSSDSSRIIFYCDDRKILKLISFELDHTDIIAVKYKGKTFYSLEGKNLTAGGGDVRSGKTYIGWMGYPETGTAEF